jgi:hypothetical protein
MSIDYTKLGAAVAAENNIDMTKPQRGGSGDYVPPAAGRCRLRFVGYVELGRHEEKYMGQPKVADKVRLFFELSGKNHQPREFEGKKVPHVISFEMTYSLNEKSNFFKLFQRMNYAGDAVHMVQLLGRAYLGEVVHRKYKRADGSEGVAAELQDKARGFLIEPPRVLDSETDTLVEVKVAEPLSPIKVFVWAKPDKLQWDSIFVDGEWEAVTDDSGKVIKPAKSKNVYQEKIRAALNFKGSPIHALLSGAGDDDLDIPEAQDGADALNGLADEDGIPY